MKIGRIIVMEEEMILNDCTKKGMKLPKRGGIYVNLEHSSVTNYLKG